jgi:hypothetical protein
VALKSQNPTEAAPCPFFLETQHINILHSAFTPLFIFVADWVMVKGIPPGV